MVNKICLNCGLKFKVGNYRKDTAKYCSRLCKSQHKSIIKECLFCKKIFKVGKCFIKFKFCSKDCQIRYNKNKGAEIVCVNCKKIFYVPFFRINEAKFCGKKCHLEFTNSDVEIKCCICKKIFVRKKWQIRNTKKHYCSRLCCQKRSPSSYEKCNCGKVFKVYASRKKYYKNLYCSNKCRLKYGIIGKLTSSNKFDKQYQKFVRSVRNCAKYYEWRSICLDRDKHRCRVCANDKKITVHHANKTMYDFVKEYGFNKDKIYGDILFFDIRNGITLCRGCHLKKHVSS